MLSLATCVRQCTFFVGFFFSVLLCLGILPKDVICVNYVFKNELDILNLELKASERFSLRFYLRRHLQELNFHCKINFLKILVEKCANFEAFSKFENWKKQYLLTYIICIVLTLNWLQSFIAFQAFWSNLETKQCPKLVQILLILAETFKFEQNCFNN